MNDPILYTLTAIMLIVIPLLSNWLSKIKLKYIFIPSILSLCISFPMYLFVAISPQLDISIYLFYISMSLWTGGFFSIFFNVYIYRRRKKVLNEK